MLVLSGNCPEKTGWAQPGGRRTSFQLSSNSFHFDRKTNKHPGRLVCCKAIWSSAAIMTCIAPGAFLPRAALAISMLVPSFLCIHTKESPLPLAICLARFHVHCETSAMDQNIQISVGMNPNNQRYQQAVLWLPSPSLRARQWRCVRKHINRLFCIRGGEKCRALHNTAALCRAKCIDESDKSSGAGCCLYRVICSWGIAVPSKTRPGELQRVCGVPALL